MTQNICILADTVECVTYTIARAAALSGSNVYVITQPKEQVKYYGHALFYEKIAAFENIKVLHQFPPMELDWLYVELTAGLNSQLATCARHAKQVGIFSSCDCQSSYVKTLGRQIKEVLRYFPVALRAKRVFLLDGWYKFDLYGLYTQRVMMGYDVHSNFLDDDTLNRQMFAFMWNPEAIRKYKFNFIGNRNPQHRTEIITTIKKHWRDREQLSGSNPLESVWIEYGDEPGEQRGVDAVEYMHLLSESDFTLSPPGYIRLTHRTIEALVQGSIPVLHEDELALYDIDLRDCVNCIAVKQQNWVAAIEALMTMPQEEVSQMRQNIFAMRDRYLTDEAFIHRLQSKMGLLCP
jgi:hypothetical protein